MGHSNKSARQFITDYISHLDSGETFVSSQFMKDVNCDAHCIGMIIKSVDGVEHQRIGRNTRWIKI